MNVNYRILRYRGFIRLKNRCISFESSYLKGTSQIEKAQILLQHLRLVNTYISSI